MVVVMVAPAASYAKNKSGEVHQARQEEQQQQRVGRLRESVLETTALVDLYVINFATLFPFPITLEFSQTAHGLLLLADMGEGGEKGNK